MRLNHCVIFLNPDDERKFASLKIIGSSTNSVVVNGEGLSLEYYCRTSLPETTSFLMIARLLGDKGIREFGAAAKLLKARYPDTPIRLVGYLDQSPDSIRQTELDEIVASGVEFVGRLEDVRPAITESSVYVLPSYREGTPRSTLEAMAMGRAVVTTDAPGCRETVVEGVNGFLVPPRDAVALAAAMEKFILDPGLAARMGAESRRIAEEKYDVNLVNAEIMRHAGL
jgi:glycosyltransferase involved in cell wall biosynthesis